MSQLGRHCHLSSYSEEYQLNMKDVTVLTLTKSKDLINLLLGQPL